MTGRIVTPDQLRDEAIAAARPWLESLAPLVPSAIDLDNLVIKLAAEVAKPAIDMVEQQAAELAELRPAPCVMTGTPPLDFAQCETHDSTFPLGGTCKFNGRTEVDVYFEEAAEQRGRAVAAEMHLEEQGQQITGEANGPGGHMTRSEWADWSNELASWLPEDAESRWSNPEGAQESIILDVLKALVEQRASVLNLVRDAMAGYHPVDHVGVLTLLKALGEGE